MRYRWSEEVALDKGRVVAAFRTRVALDLQALLQVTGDARSEATGSESKAENQYDTRATEAAYLATGQGRRLLALRALSDWLAHLDPRRAHRAIGPGALVALDRDGETEWVLIGPEGGHTVEIDGTTVQLLSSSSPLGAVLGGRVAGDTEEVDTPRGPAVLEVLSVQ